MKSILLAVALVNLAVVAGFAQAPKSENEVLIWGALVVATNTDRPEANGFTESEQPLLERLNKAFRFRHFHKLGQHSQEISREYESWLVPSQELFLKIDSMGAFQNGMKLDIQLWHHQNVVVKTNCILRSESPVFITGPMWGDDQLVLVVELRPKADPSKTAMKP